MSFLTTWPEGELSQALLLSAVCPTAVKTSLSAFLGLVWLILCKLGKREHEEINVPVNILCESSSVWLQPLVPTSHSALEPVSLLPGRLPGRPAPTQGSCDS